MEKLIPGREAEERVTPGLRAIGERFRNPGEQMAHQIT
jgi:hypothetical protein